MNENVMSRTKAREIALHLIFEMGFQQFEPENLEERLDENIMRSLKTDAEMYAGRAARTPTISAQSSRALRPMWTSLTAQSSATQRAGS